MYDQSDFESPTFDVTAFVDQLVEKSLSSSSSAAVTSEEFDSAKLYSVLSQTMCDLEELNLKMQNQLNKQQLLARKEINEQTAAINKLKAQHINCNEAFIKLESDVIEISRKLISLGDQLENISQPHSRISEAKLLIANFNEFMRSSFPKDKFTREEILLPDYVELLTKLKQVLGELDETKFQSAAGNIRSAYESVEKLLTERFELALKESDVPGMSKYARLLFRFDSYYQNCVGIFVEQIVSEFSHENENLLEDILSRSIEIDKRIQTIFPEPEVVSSNYYHQKLFMDVIQLYLDASLGLNSGNRAVQMTKLQLEMLSRLETKLQKFCDRLDRKNILSRKNTLDALKIKLFAVYLNFYIQNEKSVLSKFCNDVAQDFYSNAGHVTKNSAQLKALAKKPFSESHDYPALLFRDELVQIFKEVKASIARASRLLTSSTDKNELGRIIFDVLVSVVLDGNVIYVLSLANEGTPCTVSDLRDLKAEPVLNFFPLVARSNSIINELNAVYNDYLLANQSAGVGLISYQSTAWSQCEENRQSKIKDVETLINNTVEKVLNYYSAWIKKIYAAQTSKEFQQVDDDSAMHGPTETCKQVCVFVSHIVSHINSQLKTCSAAHTQEVIIQFGLKFHQNLVSQIQKLQFSLYGGIQISMDLSEYKKVAELFNFPLLMKLFSSLQALCNLLITPSEHLLSVINGPELESFDPTVVHDFVKLRADYRRNDLVRLFGPNSSTV